VVQTEDLPIFTTYISEVGTYSKLNIAFYEAKNPIDSSENFTFKFEVAYHGGRDKLSVKCQLYSEGTGNWQDSECLSEISEQKVKVTSKNLGTYRLILVEDSPQAELESECVMNPGPYAIVCVWFALVIFMFIISILSKASGKPELYRPTNLPPDTNRTNVFSDDRKRIPSAMDISELPQIHTTNETNMLLSIIKVHILVQMFKNHNPVDKVINMISLFTSMFLGFALLGAFTYTYGDSEDNSNDTMADMSNKYYPEDMKNVLIALAMVIPTALPLRFSHKMTGASKKVAVAFSTLTLIGSILGVLLMGAYFCQGASIRWVLSYLIFVPLELVTSEFIISTVVSLAARR